MSDKNILDGVVENIHFIISEEDSDKVKLEKIFKKMRENSINLKVENIEINHHSDTFVLGTITFNFYNNILKLPYIIEPLKFNSEIHDIISDLKKLIIFEKFGILPTQNKTHDTTSSGNATEKQKSLLRDKMQYPDSEKIIESKLKEFGLSSIDEVSKDQASRIIDNLPKRRGHG